MIETLTEKSSKTKSATNQVNYYGNVDIFA